MPEHRLRYQCKEFRYTDTIEIMLALTALCNSCGTQKAAAAQLGISPQYLHDLLAGKREVGASIAAKFGLKPIRLFVPITQGYVANVDDAAHALTDQEAQ